MAPRSRSIAAVASVVLLSANAFSLPVSKLSPQRSATTSHGRTPTMLLGLKPTRSKTTAAPLSGAKAAGVSSSLETAVAVKGGEEEGSLAKTLEIGAYFGLWYALNIGYNVYNKKALNAVPLPWTLATIQLFAGLPYVFFLWGSGLRKAPKLSVENVKTLTPSALCHLGTHVGAVLSLGAGAVSFTHIVKASEPVVSAALSAVFLKQILPIPVYLSLLPVIGGVGLASLKELSFTWLAFGTAMLSNVASASRGILSKGLMGQDIGENLSAPNLYAVLTMIAFALLLPMSLAIESPALISSSVAAAVEKGISNWDLGVFTVLSGIFYYLYNEVAFLALSKVAPVTHAVGNTIKRVVIILASVVVFGNKLTPLGAAGSGVAILGTLLYSLVKNKYK